MTGPRPERVGIPDANSVMVGTLWLDRGCRTVYVLDVTRDHISGGGPYMFEVNEGGGGIPYWRKVNNGRDGFFTRRNAKRMLERQTRREELR